MLLNVISSRTISIFCAALISLATVHAADLAEDQRFVARKFDILFRNGVVIDGSGAPRFEADVGIVGDRIAAIGDLSTGVGAREIDLGGNFIAPGFIDLHAHVVDAEYGENGLLSEDPRRRAAANYVSQGITTVLGNPDGAQPASLARQRSKLERLGVGPNIGLTNGHNGLRAIVMGDDQERPATDKEVAEMRDIIIDDMAAGRSFGLSVGSEYFSGAFSTAEEQIDLARPLPAYSGIFIAHIRSQGDAPMWYRPSRFREIDPPTLERAVDEVIAVARETGATSVVTHMKAWGRYRGRSDDLVARIQAARDEGARVYIDVYPYSSSGSDGSFAALPGWAYGPVQGDDDIDFTARLEETIAGLDAAGRQDLTDDVTHEIGMRGGPENILILNYPNSDYVGKSFADVMALRRLDPVAMAIALQIEGDPARRGGGQLRSISMADKDIETFLSQPWAATSTDGWVVLPEAAVGEKKYVDTHRRCFGSFPRRLAHYAAKRGVGTLEEAIRSITALPAEILSISDRGLLRVGMKADIAAFDMERLADNTTYLEPSVYASGMLHVLVNGEFVIDDGERTFALPGEILSR